MFFLWYSVEFSWNSRFVGSPTVVHDDGTYWMWFNGGEVTADTSYPYKIIERIGGATSRDGVNWKPLNGGKPALRLGPKGSADHRGMAHPYVLKVGDRFLMWYGAIDGRSGTDLGIAPAHVRVEQICLASSRDGIHWKKENDGRPVIVEIRGAEGGEEANLFARDLHEMYLAFAASHGWSVESLGARESDMGGFSEVMVLVKGDDAWTRLKYEGGVHRVQRVPVTESQGRVHTSSATVSVLPEAEEVEVQIDDNDLQVDVYRASGPGGQSVNTTDSAVRITHRPTGLVVSMQDEKSQLQNKAKALRVLRSRLLQIEQDRQQSEASAARRDQVGGGGRSEKIRTYNFKENRVTDHRIGLTLHRLDRILAGDLDEVTDGLMADERTRHLARGSDGGG